MRTPTQYRPPHHGTPEEVNQAAARVNDLLVIVDDAAHAFNIAWIRQQSLEPEAAIACEKARHHFFMHLSMLEGEVANLLQSLSSPCDKLPPAPLTPPESITEFTKQVTFFNLYSTCIRLVDPEDPGHQPSPETRQLINAALHDIQQAHKQQPTAKD